MWVFHNPYYNLIFTKPQSPTLLFMEPFLSMFTVIPKLLPLKNKFYSHTPLFSLYYKCVHSFLTYDL